MLSSYKLKKRLRYWKKTLGLYRWRISIEYGTVPPDCLGFVNYQKNKKVATIIVDESGSADNYIDWFLLHELVHILFARYRLKYNILNDNNFINFEEYICDSIAAALSKLKGAPIYRHHNQR